jgi:hypothetical protein
MVTLKGAKILGWISPLYYNHNIAVWLIKETKSLLQFTVIQDDIDNPCHMVIVRDSTPPSLTPRV